MPAIRRDPGGWAVAGPRAAPDVGAQIIFSGGVRVGLV
jgi:hypothetical protein